MMIPYMCWMTSQGAKTTSWGAYATYSRRKRQKKRAPERKAPNKINYGYIIPRSQQKVKSLAGYTLSDGQLRLRALD